MKKIIIASALFLLGITPAFGAILDLGNGGSSFSLNTLTNLVNQAIPLLIAIGVVFFVYALIRLILSAGDEGARTKARNQIILSIIILAAIIGVWGLVNFVLGAFGLQAGQAAPPAPQGPQSYNYITLHA